MYWELKYLLKNLIKLFVSDELLVVYNNETVDDNDDDNDGWWDMSRVETLGEEPLDNNDSPLSQTDDCLVLSVTTPVSPGTCYNHPHADENLYFNSFIDCLINYELDIFINIF